VYDERCLLHENDIPHLERPERIRRAFALLTTSGVLARCTHVPARIATSSELLQAGGVEALTKLGKFDRMTERLSKCHDVRQCEHIDGDTFFNRYSLQAASLSVGGLIDLVNRVMEGHLHNGFAIVRPPGHHADNRKASGFCLFNSVALAAQDIRAKYPDSRVAIVDWDT
jgi:histone deacetylase 6